MRHRVAHRKLNKTSTHRLAMLANMACSLIEHEKIFTTLPKAKELRPFIEKLVTTARSADDRMNTIRALMPKLRSLDHCLMLIDKVAPRYVEINGGYTRIIKCGNRYGDNAPVATIMFVNHSESEARNYFASSTNTAESLMASNFFVADEDAEDSKQSRTTEITLDASDFKSTEITEDPI